ncbi:MAG: hypothetical protein N3G22_00355 [Candidatus Micrarchaeota archaeon]|nr:hypothetical protein [Candidatus Micrarchaeota archaeon]
MAQKAEAPAGAQGEWKVFQTIVDFSRKTTSEAADIFQSLFISNPKVNAVLKNEQSRMLTLVADIYKNPDQHNISVKVGRGISKDNEMLAEVYTIMVETSAGKEFLTLRVGGDFIEASLTKGSRLKEILTISLPKGQERESEITYEKIM